MKKYLNRFCISVIFLLLLIPYISYSQLITLSKPTTGEYSSNQSIRLLSGFSTKGPFRAFITDKLNVPLGSTPSQGQNYVITDTYKQPSNIDFTDPLVSQVNQVIRYYDGLGRLSQTIQTKGSTLGNDLVQPVAYDALEREPLKYLPYAAQEGNGAYKNDALSNQKQFYSDSGWDNDVVKTQFPYSQTIVEPSVLSRIIEQGFSGAAWQPGNRSDEAGRTTMIVYGTNNSSSDYTKAGFAVRSWTATPVEEYKRSLSSTGYYSEGKLYLKVIKDENWTTKDGKAGTTEAYTDQNSKLILKRTFNLKNGNIEVLSTYYVYDDFGNLSFVLPPAADPDGAVIDQNTLDLYCYQYRYDARKRLVEKRIPGKSDWIELIYNKLDQLVYIQDPVQRINNKRSYIKYDALGHVIISGVEKNSVGDRIALQKTVTNQSVNWEFREPDGAQGYSNQSIPATSVNVDPEIVNYYNDYNIPGIPNDESANYSKQLSGLLTATKVKVLGTSDFLWTVNYYDEEGRITKQYKQHYLSGTINADNYDELLNSYNFENALTGIKRIHHRAGVANTIINNRYEYDHAGRGIETYKQINTDAEMLLAKNRYNELGQLKGKELNNRQQSTNYSYNERGWLKGSISDQFSLQLKYQDGTSPQFNGNISGQQWGSGSSMINSFNYTYDKLNRLSSGISTGMSEQITYDLMGNIQSLKRDDLVRNYSYSGNQLSKTTGGPEHDVYTYDANGNAIVDGRNGQAIEYNDLNLPVKITGLDLSYVYDASGDKLKKKSKGVVTDYIGGIQYAAGEIEFIQTEEGVARRNGANYSYEYNLHDHLGNVRYSFYKNPVTGKIERLQSDDYYPFGLRKSSGSPVSLNNKYLYNGKELQEELGQYDYGARFYDPVIGRWNGIDLLAGSHPSATPYHYVFNNPINIIDPLGLDTLPVNKLVSGDQPDARPMNSSDVFVLKEVGITAQRAPSKTIENPTAETDRIYGGDGSGSALDNTMKAMDFLNQFNPIANAWDTVTGVISGTDRFGNPQSSLETNLKFVSVLPIGKIASVTTNVTESVSQHIFRDAVGHINPTTIESQGRYLNLFAKVSSNPNNLVPTVNKAAANAGIRTFYQSFRNGNQVWVQTLNGTIRNAGVNLIAK